MSDISKELDAKIRVSAKNPCGYCLVLQKLISYRLEIEHIYPRGLGGGNEEENVWLACRQCNLSKGIKTHGFDTITFKREKLFDPRNQIWSEHFKFSEDETEIAELKQLRVRNCFSSAIKHLNKITLDDAKEIPTNFSLSFGDRTATN